MIRDAFLRRIVIALVVFGTIATSVLALAVTVTYKPWGVPDIQRAEYEQKVADIKARNEALQTRDNSTAPRAVIEQTIYDFGMMDPLQEGTHEFVIRNDGDKLLVLTGGGTTCKCTLIKGGTQTIEPGTSSTVALFWNTGRKRDYYEQQAILRTNDPLLPEIKLVVRGKVRFEIGVSVAEANFANLQPDGDGQTEFDVYSQLFYEFDIDRIETTLDDLTWKIEPLPSDALTQYDARCGYRIALTMPLRNVDSLFNGVFRMWINRPEEAIAAAASNDLATSDSSEESPSPEIEEEEEIDDPTGATILRELSVRGRVPRRLALYGKDLNGSAGLSLGILPTGKRYENRLVARTRGTTLPKVLRVAKVEPEFIQATITPKDREGWYSLTVVIPEDAPMTIFNTSESVGRIEIECDLLPSGKMVLPLSGAIVE
ncbi:hypothetical protein Poly24_51520 [Rosistilla carotiformis]|uniref:DUF1573 domain-containing protein n=1 Tax=Rosistilla carotiformis TaxID=2528017 RepID=A0A518K0U5_9BACT|nr:DUF1573 domain-containing protein [Rosistilla carotiformis]QDV71416.1 hypothetical protein Poly24_51520 [Rosistilla carotiformis]